MADEVIPPTVTAVPTTPEASAPAAAPVETSSSSAPAASSEVKPETTAAPIMETVLGTDEAPKPEVKPTEVKPEAQPVEAKPEVKPETKPVEGEKPVEVKAEEKPVEVPTYEWALPEGVQVDKDRIAEFNKELGEFALTSKADSKLMQEFGQKLVNRHIAEVQSIAEKITQAYNKVWTDQSKQWFDEFEKDPEIGGNRRDTTASAAKELIRRYGGTQEQQESLKSFFRTSGVGNHPGLIRLLANANLNRGEPSGPVKADAPAATEKMTMKTKMYGKRKS